MKANHSISVRRTFLVIQLVVGLLLVFLVVQGIILWSVCNGGASDMRNLVSEDLPSLQQLAALQENLALYRLRTYEVLFAQDKDRPAKMAQVAALDQANRDTLGQLKKDFPEGEGHQRVLAVESALANYAQVVGRMHAALEKDFAGAMLILDREVPPAVDQLSQTTAQVKSFCERSSSEQANQTIGKFSRIQTSVVGFGLTNVVIALFTAVLVALSSSRVQRTLRLLATNLSGAMDQVDDAASQVAAASQTLAEGASEQAASLEETSASLEEMSSMTKRNSENAQKANDIARQAREAADKGVGDMRTMSASMEAIKASSDDIAKIIKTIDEIAFQTNILALNAAVEAARAGEAGLGFAVVAEEVRNLAQRSAQAAKETAAKIEGAIGKTSEGVEISGKVSLTLNDIVTKVRQVDGLVAEVSSASREQTQGISQIGIAVGQVDKVTQSNAATAEESASAAEELNGQTASLKASVAELLILVGGGNKASEATAAGSGVPTNNHGFQAKAPAMKRPFPAVSRGNGSEPTLERVALDTARDN